MHSAVSPSVECLRKIGNEEGYSAEPHSWFRGFFCVRTMQ